MALRDWPAVLRAAGIQVQVHSEVNWLSKGNLRDFNLVWHHDASPYGDSPGALTFMKNNFNISSAQIWVNRYGVWHFISFGMAYHTGLVNDNRFNNVNSVGIETDHTTGEDWPSSLITSLRRGTAAVLKHENKGVDSLAFHKTICVPRGRKSDPDGLSLDVERNMVAAYMKNEIAYEAQQTIVEDDFLMALTQYDQEDVRNIVRAMDKRLQEMAEALYLHKPDGSRWPGYGMDGINNNVVGLYSLLTALAGKVDSPDIDTEGLAKAIADAIPVEYAERVVDVLAKRIEKK